jgi:HEAT repeat protein
MLYDAQQSSNPQFTQEASSAVSKTPSEPFISNTLAQLGLGNRYVPIDISLTSLLSELGNPEWQVRAAVVRRLGKLGEKAALEPLVAILVQDSIAAVRIAAARALGELVDYASVESLIAALDDPIDDVKIAAAWALGELGERVPTSTPLENLLNCNNAVVRATAIRAIGELGARTPIHILEVALEDANWQVREMAALAMEKQRDRITLTVSEP